MSAQSSSLQDKLDAMKSNFESGGPPYNLPAWIPETMNRATAELIASGAAQRAIKMGDTAPAFSLKDPDGQVVTLAGLLAEGPLVLSFYRGVWCPYCNAELQALQAALPQIKKHGARLVAISPQTPPNSRRSQRENNLDFAILSDPGNTVADQYGLRYRMPDYLIDLYRNVFKNDLTVVNGDDSWTLPMPARLVVGQDGKVRYAEVNPDYTKRPEPATLLPVLQGLRAAA